jgi:hypothetical protein
VGGKGVGDSPLPESDASCIKVYNNNFERLVSVRLAISSVGGTRLADSYASGL